ncbi:MAG: hypothetical protein ACKOPK_03160 [Dolichospermum sp.]
MTFSNNSWLRYQCLICPASLYRFDEKAFAPFKDQPLVFV